jgi:hypothetical protein
MAFEPGKSGLALVPLLFLATSALGAETAGATFEERTTVRGVQLQLNGAGVRTRMLFDVYAVSLYLPKKTSSAQEALAMPGPKRLEIRMLRDVAASQFVASLVERLGQNNTEAELKLLEPRVQQLTALLTELKQAKKGTALALDWTGAAVQLVVNGKPAGRSIEGEELYRALLRIWLGNRPAQPDLKRALLGQS